MKTQFFSQKPIKNYYSVHPNTHTHLGKENIDRKKSGKFYHTLSTHASFHNLRSQYHLYELSANTKHNILIHAKQKPDICLNIYTSLKYHRISFILEC